MSETETDDVALKLLHTADWHLGSRFPTFDGEDQKKLTRSRLDVIDTIVELAERTGVDAILCAGDLFDAPRPDKQWYEGLAKSLEQSRESRPIFLLPGNHDPLIPGSVYDPTHPFRRMLPSWVHVVDQDDYVFTLNEHAVLYAAPCRSMAGEKDLALALPPRAPGDDRLRIGLVHGTTFDLPGHETNFPIHRDAAVLRRLDYLAIGDTHSFREVCPDAPVPTVYPGAPESTKFGENESGHVAVVFFPPRGRRAMVRKERVGRWRWREVTCPDLAALRALGDDKGLRHSVIRLILDMTVTIQEMEEVERILTELKGTESTHGRIEILQVDRKHLAVAAKVPENAFSPDLPDALKMTVALLQEQAEGLEGEIAARALCHLLKLVHARV